MERPAHKPVTVSALSASNAQVATVQMYSEALMAAEQRIVMLEDALAKALSVRVAEAPAPHSGE